MSDIWLLTKQKLALVIMHQLCKHVWKQLHVAQKFSSNGFDFLAFENTDQISTSKIAHSLSQQRVQLVFVRGQNYWCLSDFLLTSWRVWILVDTAIGLCFLTWLRFITQSCSQTSFFHTHLISNRFFFALFFSLKSARLME